MVCFNLIFCGVISSAANVVNSGGTISLPVYHSFLLQTKEPVLRASVADPGVVDITIVTPEQILILAKAKIASSTSLILWYDKTKALTYDIVVFNTIPIAVITAIRETIQKIAPGVKIKVMEAGAIPKDERVLLTGSVESQEVLDKVLKVADSFGVDVYNLIRLEGPQQVQLEVTIAEISRTGLKQMGINFLEISGNKTFGLLRGGTWDGTMPSDVTVYSPFSSAFEIILARSDWLSMIGLLKSQGLARTLASPTLVTMNGQKANFQVGGEYPIPVQGDNGSTSIEYKKYGIMLEFTPYILDSNTITLEVSPEVSMPDYSLSVASGGASVPGLSSRKASTTLQLRPGQTFAMAGLLKEEYHQNIAKVPFLGDLPYIGTLFTNKEVEYQESELVVIVTPKFVVAMDAQEVPDLPGSGVRKRIDDMDFFIKNDTDSQAMSDKGFLRFKDTKGFIR